MRLLERSRSSLYWDRSRRDVRNKPGHKRGPKTEHTDSELIEHIRSVLQASPFLGEGHRKVWARLRARNVRSASCA